MIKIILISSRRDFCLSHDQLKIKMVVVSGRRGWCGLFWDPCLVVELAGAQLLSLLLLLLATEALQWFCASAALVSSSFLAVLVWNWKVAQPVFSQFQRSFTGTHGLREAGELSSAARPCRAPAWCSLTAGVCHWLAGFGVGLDLPSFTFKQVWQVWLLLPVAKSSACRAPAEQTGTDVCFNRYQELQETQQTAFCVYTHGRFKACVFCWTFCKKQQQLAASLVPRTVRWKSVEIVEMTQYQSGSCSAVTLMCRCLPDNLGRQGCRFSSVFFERVVFLKAVHRIVSEAACSQQPEPIYLLSA